ncbi:MAG: MmgE/PrpD family protein [Pseudomonadota bacterium]
MRFTAMDSVTHVLARFACDGHADAEALSVMQLSLLDWIAVASAAMNEPVTRIMQAQAKEEAGTPQASVFGMPQMVPARMAALANGTISHALDYDDTHFSHIGHPSVAVVPAALAVAEMIDASGAAFQSAASLGAEASVRVGEWLGRGHYQIGFHQTSTAGAFGATIAAGHVLGLDEQMMRNALGLVATRASGLKSEFGTMGKPFNAGQAAANGVEAALLAAKGFEAASHALAGPLGFGETHHGAGDTTAFDNLGDTWRFPTVKHKFHACCHGLHATLEALRDNQCAPNEISKIEIYTHPRWMSVCNIEHPTTGLEAKFSYKMVTALQVLGYDTARLDTFCDALCKEENVARLMNLIEVIEEPELTEMQSRVLVKSHIGDDSLFHDLDDFMPFTQRRSRVFAKSASLLGNDRANALWSLIEAQASAAEIGAALR